ncbi:hypothetical protein GCM10028803_40910 [Larkinella knui]|uniref:Uncharacterized protein n=1 Tax=Larkinella knui TaxID=2025310 RepID=A0A3P1CN66_9BACT|nr:hypothetical protein [Larkinella knui]RRB14725.1 hypothetical protein EHT87_09135 [Larkinella knui]
MTLVLDIPEQKVRQAEAVAQAEGKTLQQVLEEFVDGLAQQGTQSTWENLSNRLPDIAELKESDIEAEIKTVRADRRKHTQAE